MNKLLRVLWLMLTARFAARVSALGPCRTRLRVWPHDLDLLWHMNNGVYLSLMDLGRLDMMLRSGAWKRFNQAGWYPVVVAETIQFRRSLNLFDRFEIETRVLGWDDKAIVLEQQFFRGSESVAHALVRVRFLAKKGGNVAPRELMEYLGETPDSPPLEGYAAEWNALQGRWQGARPQ